MEEVTRLKTLKTIKRKANFLYTFCRTVYENKIRTSLPENRKVFYEAISALDAMHRMYEILKTSMIKEPFIEQIKFATKWSTYISCIDAMTAYKTKDKYLLRGITLEESFARQTSLELWLSFNKQLKSF